MKYGLTSEEWHTAQEEIRHILIGVAKLETTITYGELASQLMTISPHAGSYVFHALLRAVCKAEREAQRGHLCAVVVSKATGIPGQGFFKMMMKHGYDCHDQKACWQSEINRLYEIWGE
ncbi:MAG: hypothetical protein AAFV93_09165 [Chloroflexota bacterium]